MSPNALDRSDQHLRPISIFFSFFLSFLFRYNLLPVVYVCKALGEVSRRNISFFFLLPLLVLGFAMATMMKPLRVSQSIFVSEIYSRHSTYVRCGRVRPPLVGVRNRKLLTPFPIDCDDPFFFRGRTGRMAVGDIVTSYSFLKNFRLPPS
jgi:hypothetical protein